MIVKQDSAMPRGFIVLSLYGKIVWHGALGSPIEDVECDEVTMHPEDFDRVVETYLKIKKT